jgi:CheY-like chemotaxis protein
MATILIIDDEESVRALLRFPLEAAGHEKPSAVEKAVTSLYPSLKWLTLDDNHHI